MGVFGAVLAVVLAASIVTGVHWYVWRRLVRDGSAAGSLGRRLGTAVVWCGGLFLAATVMMRFISVPFIAVRVVSCVGYLWAALLVYLLLGVLAGEIVRPVLLRLLDKRGPAAGPGDSRAEKDSAATQTTQPPSPAVTRRLFVSRVLTGVTAAVAVGTVAGGTYSVLKGPAVNQVRVPLRRLPAAASGFRIALVADMHLGPALGAGFARTVVDTVNRTRPDLIVIAGDLVDAQVGQLRSATAPLAELRAVHGTYFITGNHEYYSGADEWIEYLPSLGMKVLLNSHVSLPGFDLAGVDDLAGKAIGRGPDLDKALRGRDTTRPCVLVAHQPVLIHEAVKHGIDLQLSGHTHGGQMFPGNLIAALANPTLAGLERYGDSQLYVTRGAGAWGPPVRVGAPSDITVLELVAAAG